MWLRPRATVRQILESEIRPSLVPVVALAAFCAVLNNIQFDPEAGAVSFSRSAMPVAMGAARIVCGVLIGPFIFAVVGGWLGGEGDPDDIRQGLAWSYVPFGAAAVLWVVVLLTYGAAVFDPAHTPQSAVQWAASTLMVVIFVCYVWTIPLLVAALAEVMRFSIFKSILTVLIPLVPLWLLEAIT